MPEQEQNQPGARGILERIRENLGQETSETTEGTAGQKETVLQEEAGLLLENTPEITDKGAVPVIHTLQGDISEYIKTKDMSLVDIAAEATRQQQKFNGDTSRHPKKILLIFALIFLFSAALTAGTWLYLKKEEASPDKKNLVIPQPLILSEETKIISLASERRLNFINLVQESLKAEIPLNSIRYLPIILKTEKEEYLDAQKFLNILAVSPPTNFIQSLDGPFTLGVFNLKKNSPILIFKIRSFDLAFSGILSWEKGIARDLKDVMLIKNPPASGNFRDKVIKNHDVRVLYDESEKPVLMHSFMDKERLIITTDFEALEEIFERVSGL